MDDALARLVREWLTRALHDLQTACIIAGTPSGPLDTAVYHCQQAAEKSVKGWLTAGGFPSDRTHDIRRLVGQAAGPCPDFLRFSAAAEFLTPYASAFRYPGLADGTMPSREEADEALRHAQAMYDFVLHLLPVEMRP